MPTDLTVFLEDRPGTLADLAEALGRAGVNIEGGCGFSCEGRGVFHVMVEDAGAARQALEASGFAIERQQEVLALEVEDRPGTLAQIARRIADAGVNIDLFYLATQTRLVLGTDDLTKARDALA